MTRADSREVLLTEIAVLRGALVAAAGEAPIMNRISSFCAGLQVWAKLPLDNVRIYTMAVLDRLFDLIADVEESAELSDNARRIVELSLWDVAVELNLDRVDRRYSTFIAARRQRLMESLRVGCSTPVERLVYAWGSLLWSRPQTPPQFAGDAAEVIRELTGLGLPRRATAVASKFNQPVDAVTQWTVKNRPAHEEVQRTQKLIERLTLRRPALPYRVLTCARDLCRILSDPLSAITLSVNGNGCIFIGRRTYGVTTRRF